MKIKLLVSLLAASIFSLYANTKTNDLMNIRINENVILKNGFGTISGKPILNDKSLEDKLYLRGEFNVDEKNNASFEFNKLEHEGKIYNLNNAFVKKGRLRNTNITLKKDSNLTVSGGNKDEILSILNAIDQQDRKDNKDLSKDENNGNTSFNSLPGGASNSSPAFSPSLLKDNDNNDKNNTSYTSSKDDKNSAVVVDCPEASYDGNIATYYIQLGTICTKRTSLSVKTIYNSNSCKSKVDYKNNKIELGFELFAVDPEGGSFLVQRCQYKEPIDLIAKVRNCKAIPNYETNKAEVQKQYSYIWEKEEKDVGDCTPTGEIIDLQYDINTCDEDRHDFEKNISIEQGRYFYLYDNDKTFVGECVDIPKYTYTHYKNDSTCKYKVNDGRVQYLQRIAYDDLNKVQRFATDCEVTNSGGLEIFTEFAGYEYREASKQALRKIHQFFIIPGTTTKKYITQDIVTDKAYPYIEQDCGITHDDEKLISTYNTTTFFNDTDENKKVEIQPCQQKRVTPYTLINGSTQETFISNLGFKELIKRPDNRYHILGAEEKLIDQSNGVFPVDKSGTYSITTLSWDSSYLSPCNRLNVSYSSCNDGNILTANRSDTCTKTRHSNEGDDSTYTKTSNYTLRTCKRHQYWETIGEYSSKKKYLRGDGTELVQDNGFIYKIIR